MKEIKCIIYVVHELSSCVILQNETASGLCTLGPNRNKRRKKISFGLKVLFGPAGTKEINRFWAYASHRPKMITKHW